MILVHSQGEFFKDNIGLGNFGVLDFSANLPDNHSLETQHLWFPDNQIHSLTEVTPSLPSDFIVRQVIAGRLQLPKIKEWRELV